MTLGVVLLVSAAVAAQERGSEISLQGTGFFTKDSTGRGTLQRGTETGGFLVGYRNTQQYFSPAGLSRIQANVHEATGGFVLNLPAPHRFRISPYVLAEGGALVFDPTNDRFGSVAGAQRQTTGVFAYGGGADFPIISHVSLRAEYRGLVYRTPDFGLRALNTNTVTHTAQPSAGLVFRF
jgi:opacity protein-like surface antigen